MRNITVLSGGIGGALLARGLQHGIAAGTLPEVPADATVTVVAGTAGDLWVHGLKSCPDLDTVMYALGDGTGPDLGGARRDETWSVKEELAAYGVEPSWFALGDREVATHLVRTQMLEAGYPLSAVTEALSRRWRPGARLLPMTDDRVEAHVAVADADSPSGRRAVHLQEYRAGRAAEPAEAVLLVGLDAATPGPGVLEAVADADLVLLAPSDPVVQLGPVLGVPGVREALLGTRARVVGVSPVVGGEPVAGTTRTLLEWAGIEVDASAVGLHHGSRGAGGLLDGWLVDERDEGGLPRLAGAGLAAAAVPLTGTSPEARARVVAAAAGLVA